MSVFNELYAGKYDSFYAGKDYKAECDLVEAELRKSKITLERILDLGCGTGNHAIILGQRNLFVTGIDQSESMVSIAKKKALAAKVQNVEFQQNSIDRFEVSTKYDGAIMMFAVLSYLTSNELLISSLKNVRSSLKPGAKFICDFWYGPSVLSVRPSDRVRVFNDQNGKTVRSVSTELNSFMQTADVKIQVIHINMEGKVTESHETHPMRYFFPQELELIFKLAGFKLETLGTMTDLQKIPTDNDWTAIAVATAI